MRNLYWLARRHSKLNLANQRLLYVAIIKPICTYDIQLCGIIQCCQNIALSTIVSECRFDRYDVVQCNLRILSIQDEIIKFANKLANRLELDAKADAKKFLENSQDIGQLRCLKPYDLV